MSGNLAGDMVAQSESFDDPLVIALNALEIIAGKKQCVDNLMSNVDVAEWALKKIAELRGS